MYIKLRYANGRKTLAWLCSLPSTDVGTNAILYRDSLFIIPNGEQTEWK